ncbi:MAG: hypothetical protein K2J85_00900, partial [Anaeroplasmataceae bacterium]|nr:hypothetical protein [Anaeroplasmataceae bacterium]
YISMFFLLILFLFDLYYVINLIYDNRIRKYGKTKKARIVKVNNCFYARSRDTVIVYEYKNNHGKTIQTKEFIGRSFTRYLKENDRIIIRTNGVKGVISRKDYK